MSDQPVRVGVIGCGAITQRSHIPSLVAAGATLTGFASSDGATAKVTAAQHPGAVAYDDWTDLVDADDIDAVLIATPNQLHHEQAIAALEAGKHVLVEKPFTTTVAFADAVLACAERHDRILMTAHNARFAAPVAALRHAVSTGAVGEVRSVRGVFCHAGPAAWSPSSTWFFEPALAGGGALLDLGVHLIDVVRHVTGVEFASVVGVLDRPEPVEHDAIVGFEMANGAVGMLHAGWRSAAGPDLAVEVLGSEATARFRGTDAELVTPTGTVEPLASEPGRHESPQAAFVEAVRSGVPGTPDGRDGRAAVAVVEAAYRSAQSGRRVEVD